MSRVGLLLKKVGCTSVYDDKCAVVPITLLKLEENVVLSNEDKGDSVVVKLSFGRKKLKKPQAGYFKKLGLDGGGRIVEFRTSRKFAPEPLKSLTVEHFRPGQYVDVVGTSIGKGFAGVMKRHNFAGLRASHGVSISHRSGGSTGQCQDPGKVFKGKKMAGHMGAARVTIQNLFVQLVDVESGLIGVRGSVPGCKNSYVLLKDALKKGLFV
ncbi:50S ribosomal protein L3 [Neorickettsia helminthoeca str. Oregon]|uniref:50S ribosomal protein L3 n=1 Tax=Neorickettsia helminthoeca str. Oregon TaxID=1286528 RepID=X5HLF0_9RICK|nr:50S ribosomal protein L3 [Neorickettsia helminthoeca]AHX11210.1 50S ribosomal protein L3 [Neorickettsia helminthoeca str. Oregon]